MNDINTTKKPAAGQEIDLLKLAAKVWAGRWTVCKACGVAFVVGIIVAYSIPKEYTTSVLLAPELRPRTSSSMGALAAMAGINLGSSSGQDAISPSLFPEIVSSTPFLTGMFNVQVTDQKGELHATLFEYLSEHQRSPWWSVVTGAPFKLLGWVLSLGKDKDDDDANAAKQVDVFKLTPKETAIAGAIKHRIDVQVEQKTNMITLSVTMQDPLISASLADTVTQSLQNYVTEYRTNKARKDLEYAEKIYAESYKDYCEAQEKYANYVDGNQNVIMQRYRAEQTRLQNEMNLAYNVYSQVAQQLQMAKAKVQEITPVYTIVQPASVPLRPVKPNKMMILVGFIFLAGAGSVGWILFKDIFRRKDAE